MTRVTNNYGDRITVKGRHNVGKNHGTITYQSTPAVPAAVLRDLEDAVDELRRQLSRHDREVVDQSLDTVRSGAADPSTMRTALGAIAGVASLVSGVGAPVVGAVKAVMTALAL